MKILISHEFSGILREACRRLGHEAISCDLLDTEIPGPHYRGSVFDIIGQGFDAHVAFPPCTYVCSSGLHWNKRVPGRAEKTEAALAHVERLRNAGVPQFAMENPVGCISTRWRKPDQKIQPYEFGENASKLTCLWLEGLPLLCPTGRFDGRVVTWKGKQVVAVDVARQCCEEVSRRFGGTVHCRDFLTCTPAEFGYFAAVIMNPPFHMRADIRHILHALTFMKPGAKLAALCLHTPHRIQALKPLCDTWEVLPRDTFAKEGTHVETVILSITKK